MSKGQGGFIIGLLALLLVLSAYNTFSPIAVKPATSWEYRVESIPDESFTTSIDKLGEEGWEVVFARRATSSSDSNFSGNQKPTFSYEMIFKRPKQSH